MNSIYVIGSLRNPKIPEVAEAIKALGIEAFADWHAAGPEADDEWRRYETERGHNYAEALKGYAAKHVFEFDRFHLDRCDAAVLVMPAGKSAHLELGYMVGKRRHTFVLFPDGEGALRKLPEQWSWLTGVFEGEGSITRNGKREGHGLQLTVTMKDEDIIRRLKTVSGVGSVEGPYKRDNEKWSDMWRWSVRRRQHVLFVMKGMLEHLGERRKEQFKSVLSAAGVSDFEIEKAAEPHEARYDVMYQFADKVYFSLQEFIDTLAAYKVEALRG